LSLNAGLVYSPWIPGIAVLKSSHEDSSNLNSRRKIITNNWSKTSYLCYLNLQIQGVPLLLDILDTNFNFPDMRKVSIASANAFLLVFAVDDVPSFKEMSDIWQEICARRPDLATLPVVVVGNKCDLPSKKIFEDTAKAFTSRLSGDVRYLEVSAKTNLRVTEIFRTLLELSGFPHNNSKNREWVASSPLLRVKSARTRSTSREGVRHHSRVCCKLFNLTQ
uniref:Ras family protein n=1 Tax=Angiostrongylus cantonensis TaxID=6313 RepID=A0A0K0DN87_ANGCA